MLSAGFCKSLHGNVNLFEGHHQSTGGPREFYAECNLCDCIGHIHAIVSMTLSRSLRLSKWYAQLGQYNSRWLKPFWVGPIARSVKRHALARSVQCAIRLGEDICHE
jgi:hypothetical protein